MFAIAAHLVYWGMATIIYPLCESNVYVVAPDSSTNMYVDNIGLSSYILFAISVARTCLPACVSACVRSFVRSVGGWVGQSVVRSLGDLDSFRLSFVHWLSSFGRSFWLLIVDLLGR